MVETAEAKQVCGAASTLLYPELDWGLRQQKATLRRMFYSPFAGESGRWHGL